MDSSLTKDVSKLLVVVKATKQMMRAYKDFAKHHRMSQLESMLPQLKIFVPDLQGLGWSVGSHLGSAYVKAIFFEQVRLTGITAALETLTPEALTWSGNGGACTAPGEVVVDCMSLAVFNKLKGSANTVGAAAPAADEKKWDETKTNFLSDVVSTISYFDTNEAVHNDKSLVFKEMLLAFQMILRAATKQAGVSPTDLRGAFDLLENTGCGRRTA